jgi:predicted ATP-binding protein involved in virulence
VNVTAYRCLKELQLDISDHTVLIGPNGSGKPSVLYALDWFFNAGLLTDDDFTDQSTT